jgi:hypothetical protein
MSRHNSSIILNWPILLLRGAALSPLARGPFGFSNPRTPFGSLRSFRNTKIRWSVADHLFPSICTYNILYWFCIYKTSLPDPCVPRVSSKIATRFIYTDVRRRPRKLITRASDRSIDFVRAKREIHIRDAKLEQVSFKSVVSFEWWDSKRIFFIRFRRCTVGATLTNTHEHCSCRSSQLPSACGLYLDRETACAVFYFNRYLRLKDIGSPLDTETFDSLLANRASIEMSYKQITGLTFKRSGTIAGQSIARCSYLSSSGRRANTRVNYLKYGNLSPILIAQKHTRRSYEVTRFVAPMYRGFFAVSVS